MESKWLEKCNPYPSIEHVRESKIRKTYSFGYMTEKVMTMEKCQSYLLLPISDYMLPQAFMASPYWSKNASDA